MCGSRLCHVDGRSSSSYRIRYSLVSTLGCQQLKTPLQNLSRRRRVKWRQPIWMRRLRGSAELPAKYSARSGKRNAFLKNWMCDSLMIRIIKYDGHRRVRRVSDKCEPDAAPSLQKQVCVLLNTVHEQCPLRKAKKPFQSPTATTSNLCQQFVF